MYPEPNSMALRKCIAGKHHLKPSQVIIGNGSDNILDMITRVLLELDKRVLRT